MKFKLLLCSAIGLVFSFQACKKGDTINNYYENGIFKPPVRKPLIEYGSTVDTSSRIILQYVNNNPDKLKEVRSYGSGAATDNFVVLYNSANQPVGFESHSPVAGTLQRKGIYHSDKAGRVVKIINLDTLGDTSTIVTISYGTNESLKPAVISYYNYPKNRTDYFEYLHYDSRGNMVSAEGYRYEAGKTYKYSQIQAAGFGNVISPFSCLYLVFISQEGSSGIGSFGSLLCSYFMPEFISTTYYLPDGKLDNVSSSSYELTADENNHLVKSRFGQGPSATELYMKY